MRLKPKITIFDHFSEIEDPRINRTKKHKLIDIITITICAVISGADNWVAIETYGCAKYEWLKEFLELPHGIPSHDTFERLFARLSPQEFQGCFLNWVKTVEKKIPEEVIAIDGKTLCNSGDKGEEKRAIHIVSAWAIEQRLVLGQRKVDDKSNEIKAIPELLKVLDLAGCIVTIDAMGCQKEIVKLITNQSAEYIISLKKNQGNLYKEVDELFKKGIRERFEGYSYSTYQIKETEHGRKEQRNYVVLNNIGEELIKGKEWGKLNSIGMVEYIREQNGKTKVEIRYFISSLNKDAETLAKKIRGHWGIENSLHWVLDVQFDEDNSRVRKDNSPENLAVVRHIALNLLGQEKSVKIGVKNRRFLAAMDNDYLMKVLSRI